MPTIIRLTLFKLTSEEGVKEATNLYSTLVQDAKMDGQSYIISSSANATYDDPRNQGYNFVSYLVFSSEEDMKYYDDQDAAHQEIKAALKQYVGGPPLVVYMDSNPQVQNPN